ncbi:hypothetical protein B0H10DRAFT_1333461 [Mycena sp. CBHHK59/15]|nr:hypothetical protein B0H10DRAFT_1333461 [Mycena sp. CBHHK59/15]
MEVLRLCEDRWPNAGMLRDVISELASVGQLPARSAPFGNDDGQQHRTAGNASDTAQSLSADDMLRIMLKSPGLQDAFDFPVRDPHLAAHLPQEYFESTIAGGAGPVDSNVFAPAPLPSNWLTPEQLLSGMDAAGRVSHEIDNMWDTNLTWLNVPTGFEVEDWGRNFADFGTMAAKYNHEDTYISSTRSHWAGNDGGQVRTKSCAERR